MKNSWLSLENGIRKVLNFLLGVPVRIYFEIILVIVLLILGLDLYHEARHQYSPVVQRVHFGDMNIRNSLWIDISAALDDKLDDAFESEVKGNQYVGINIQDVGSVERVNSVPVEVAEFIKEHIDIENLEIDPRIKKRAGDAALFDNDYWGLKDHFDKFISKKLKEIRVVPF